MPGMAGHVSVANARRDDAIRRIKRQIDHLHGEIRHSNGGIGADGMPNDYLRERLELLRADVVRLEGEIARMNTLTDKELIEEFVPAVAQFEAMKDEPVPSFKDSLQRGAMLHAAGGGSPQPSARLA